MHPRETTYRYFKDNMVYELTSPKGEVYRVQSYAQLEDLGERLDLPEGWSYKAKILN